jgi:hypothetical protein
MVFRRNRSELPYAPSQNAVMHSVTPRQRFVPCWKIDARGRLVTTWKVLVESGGELSG